MASQNLTDPARPPPPNTVSNFNDPSDLYPWVCFTLVANLLISTLAVAVRLFTRRYLMKLVVVEDYLIVLAWFAQIGEIIPTMLSVDSGLAKHMWDITLGQFIRGSSYLGPTCICYGITVCLIKVSVLLQYLRVFVPIRQVNQLLFFACWLGIVATTVFYTYNVITEGVAYQHSSKAQAAVVNKEFYLHDKVAFKTSGFFNAISDFLILILPLPTIWGLRVSCRRKLIIMSLFLPGLFACIASILRLYYTWRMYEAYDSSWNLCIMSLWTWAEFCTGILAFCLPVFPTFWNFLKAKLHARTLNALESESRGSNTSDSEFGTYDKDKYRVPKAFSLQNARSFASDEHRSVPTLGRSYTNDSEPSSEAFEHLPLQQLDV